MLSLPENPRILVVRPDRIGDFVLSFPVFWALRKKYPGAKIDTLVRPYTAPLARAHPAISEVIELDEDDHHSSLFGAIKLAGKLKNANYHAAVILYSTFWISAAVYLAGIPARIGPASKLAAIFHKPALRQNRSRGEKHEADYNLDLLAPLGIVPVKPDYSFPVPPESARKAESLLAESLIDKSNLGKKVVGIHPGSGGSSPNWPLEFYSELACRLTDEKNIFVAVTGAKHEAGIVERVASAGRPGKTITVTGLDILDFAGLVSKFAVFVAPSTGTLHIACATGTPAVGIYAPSRACHPRRWGPKGDRAVSILPPEPADCADTQCNNCRYFDCMAKITVETVYKAVMNSLKDDLK